MPDVEPIKPLAVQVFKGAPKLTPLKVEILKHWYEIWTEGASVASDRATQADCYYSAGTMEDVLNLLYENRTRVILKKATGAHKALKNVPSQHLALKMLAVIAAAGVGTYVVLRVDEQTHQHFKAREKLESTGKTNLETIGPECFLDDTGTTIYYKGRTFDLCDLDRD